MSIKLPKLKRADFNKVKKKKILFLCYNQNLSRYLSNLFSEEPLIEVHSLF